MLTSDILTYFDQSNLRVFGADLCLRPGNVHVDHGAYDVDRAWYGGCLALIYKMVSWISCLDPPICSVCLKHPAGFSYIYQLFRHLVTTEQNDWIHEPNIQWQADLLVKHWHFSMVWLIPGIEAFTLVFFCSLDSLAYQPNLEQKNAFVEVFWIHDWSPPMLPRWPILIPKWRNIVLILDNIVT